jgi:opacity protein-like surface antigen
MRNHILCATGLLAAVAAQPARAADLPMAAPVYKAPVPAAATWTGFYIGANGGWASSGINYPGVPDHANGGPADLGTLNGGLVGGQIGYNYQIQNWVFGIEGDFDWAEGLKTSALDGNYLSESNSIKWAAMARARVGYAFGQFLPYMTAGGIWVRGRPVNRAPVELEAESVRPAGHTASRTSRHIPASCGVAALNTPLPRSRLKACTPTWARRPMLWA